MKEDIECRIRPTYVKAFAATLLTNEGSRVARLFRALVIGEFPKVGLSSWFNDTPKTASLERFRFATPEPLSTPTHPAVRAVLNVRFNLTAALRERLNDTFDEATIAEASKQASEKRKR